MKMQQTLSELSEKFRGGEGNIITLLQQTQDAFGYVPREAVYWYSKEFDIPASRFFGIATFYAQFHLKPRGKHIITTCCGTACHVRGAERLVNAAKRELNLGEEEDTTEDGKFTLEKLACLGTCSMAPVVVINKKMLGKMTPDRFSKEIKTLKKEAHG
ncbi:MAG TPA: NAD(P)H-dependent oxidoreductase subunit E [Dissulfurispiraceae bacterium]|nr:NAD(P)H-dependent oxidoreductase subunit E [Dissulfurispiraceae bacterium]